MYYSLNESTLVYVFVPKSVAEFESKHADHPNMICNCKTTSIRMDTFATLTLTVNPACAWVQADLARIDDDNDSTVSACETKEAMTHYCRTVNSACKRANTTLEWALNEFNSYVVPSVTLNNRATLSVLVNQTVESNIRLAEIISAAPMETVEAWASDNMPKMVRMTGDLANRVKVLSVRSRRNSSSTPAGVFSLNPNMKVDDWDEFSAACKAATSNACDPEFVGDGRCDEACLVDRCFHDGGDCRGDRLDGGFEDEKGTFTIYDGAKYLDFDSGDYVDDYGTQPLT